MNQPKKSINFGFRGWMLILFQAIAFVTYQAATNYPLNILNGLFDGFGGAPSGQQLLSMIYTVAAVIGIICQLVLSNYIGRAKSVKRIALGLGAVTLVLLLLMMLLPAPSGVWLLCYGLVNISSVMYATFAVGILIGQWFPTRKGTVMGIATFAFPIANGLVSVFAGRAFAKGYPDIFGAFLPFFIVFVLGWLIGLVFITDYPEQCGAYRDNDKSMTPEVARAMMEQEIENKKTTVWKLGHTLACRDFWFITIPMGFLLMFSVGTMTQTQDIIGQVGLDFGSTMGMIMIFGLLGSYLLGLLDTKFGTKRSVLIALCIMVAAGVLGALSSRENPGLLRLALICLALFMGASSNYTVSAAAQYWRREDFSSVFAVVNPVANVLASSGPAVVAMLFHSSMGYRAIFIVTAVVAVLSIILTLMFSPAHVKEMDDRYRAAAGKPLDDALVGRK